MTQPYRRTRVLDDELLELFADNPEALAVVEAIARSGVGHRRRPSTRMWIALAAVIAILIVGVGAFTRTTSQASVIDSALAALPHDRVARLTVVDELPAGERIDLSTGKTVLVRHTLTEWFDPVTGRRRLRDALGGVAFRDTLPVSSTRSRGFAEDAIARFPALYRAELLQAINSSVSPGRSNGANVYWIRFRSGHQLRAVAVDRRTYHPVRAIFRDGAATRAFQISALVTLPLYTPIPQPKAMPPPVSSRLSLNPATSDEAIRRGLVGGAILAGPLGQPSRTFIGGDAASPVGVYLFFEGQARGALPSRYVRVEEARAPQSSSGWSAPIVAITRQPETLFLVRDQGLWTGFLSAHRRFFQIASTSGRAKLLTVARRLATSG
jgi:hypothetical protein